MDHAALRVIDRVIGDYEQVASRRSVVDCARALTSLFADVNITQHFVFLDGPSGCGKTQTAFALENALRVVRMDMAN